MQAYLLFPKILFKFNPNNIPLKRVFCPRQKACKHNMSDMNRQRSQRILNQK